MLSWTVYSRYSLNIWTSFVYNIIVSLFYVYSPPFLIWSPAIFISRRVALRTPKSPRYETFEASSENLGVCVIHLCKSSSGWSNIWSNLSGYYSTINWYAIGRMKDLTHDGSYEVIALLPHAYRIYIRSYESNTCFSANTRHRYPRYSKELSFDEYFVVSVIYGNFKSSFTISLISFLKTLQRSGLDLNKAASVRYE